MDDKKITEEAIAEKPEKKKGNTKIIIIILSTLVLIAGVGVGLYFIWRGANYISTDNARVTTTLIAVLPPAPGILERFTISEGQFVYQNEILGWVENSEAMRSPIDGLVIHTNAVQNQIVSPEEPLAVIADTSSLHIQANIEETGIARIQLGQPASVTIDTFGSRQFTGYVSEIGHITEAELSGNAMFFTTGGTFTRVTHLIPVKINITDNVDLNSFIGVNARVRIALNQTASGHTVIPRPAPPAGSITVRGTVESVDRRNVYSTLGYLVEKIYVEEGDWVNAGQILGVLDTEDLNIHILNAQAALQMADVNLATAEHNHEMLSVLHDAAAIPLNDLRHAEFALQSALAARQQTWAQLEAARLALERSVIRAPISGTVTAVIAREGAVGAGLLFIVEDDNLKVTTSFREYDLSRIQTGMEVIITADATGSAEYSGVISRINPAASLAAPVVEFQAEVLVTSPNTDLRIGMNTRIHIITE